MRENEQECGKMGKFSFFAHPRLRDWLHPCHSETFNLSKEMFTNILNFNGENVVPSCAKLGKFKVALSYLNILF